MHHGHQNRSRHLRPARLRGKAKTRRGQVPAAAENRFPTTRLSRKLINKYLKKFISRLSSSMNCSLKKLTLPKDWRRSSSREAGQEMGPCTRRDAAVGRTGSLLEWGWLARAQRTGPTCHCGQVGGDSGVVRNSDHFSLLCLFSFDTLRGLHLLHWLAGNSKHIELVFFKYLINRPRPTLTRSTTMAKQCHWSTCA